MERNGSFVSGYLWEIVPSAKEPRKDLHDTQNSSEARPKDFLPLRDSPLPGEGLVNCREADSATSPAAAAPGRLGVFLD